MAQYGKAFWSAVLGAAAGATLWLLAAKRQPRPVAKAGLLDRTVYSTLFGPPRPGPAP